MLFSCGLSVDACTSFTRQSQQRSQCHAHSEESAVKAVIFANTMPNGINGHHTPSRSFPSSLSPPSFRPTFFLIDSSHTYYTPSTLSPTAKPRTNTNPSPIFLYTAAYTQPLAPLAHHTNRRTILFQSTPHLPNPTQPNSTRPPALHTLLHDL